MLRNLASFTFYLISEINYFVYQKKVLTLENFIADCYLWDAWHLILHQLLCEVLLI